MSIKHYCDNEDCDKELGFYKERYYSLTVSVEGKNTPRLSTRTSYDFCKSCYFKLNKELNKIGIDLRK